MGDVVGVQIYFLHAKDGRGIDQPRIQEASAILGRNGYPRAIQNTGSAETPSWEYHSDIAYKGRALDELTEAKLEFRRSS